jgi:hypothetical protein
MNFGSKSPVPAALAQVKIFSLKDVFLAEKILRTARTVVMMLPAIYPFRDMYEKCMA